MGEGSTTAVVKKLLASNSLVVGDDASISRASTESASTAVTIGDGSSMVSTRQTQIFDCSSTTTTTGLPRDSTTRR
jgi:hypothetical protein